MKTLDSVPLALSEGELDFATFDHLKAYRELGPIYRVPFRGETWVCLGGLEANDLAWRTPDAWSYQDAMPAFTEIMGPTHVTQLDREPHREKRRHLKPGFAMSALARWIPTVDQTVAGGLAEAAGHPVPFHDFTMRVLTQANCETTVQEDLDREELDAFIAFEEDFIGNTFREDADRQRYYARPEFVALKERVLGHCERIARARLDGLRRDDSLQAILDERIERGFPPAIEELVPEIYLLLMAGTGNTAKTLSCGLQHLRERSDWLALLREELQAYDAASLLRGMSDFPCLKATLLEMERIFPAAPVLPRVVAEPIEFAGYRLEPGTKVLHLHTLTHFLEEIHPEPYAFRPERWLEEAPPRKAHGTFGGGTHICLGINLARIHMPIILGNLLRDYVFEPVPTEEIRVVFHYGVPQKADLTLTLYPHSKTNALPS